MPVHTARSMDWSRILDWSSYKKVIYHSCPQEWQVLFQSSEVFRGVLWQGSEQKDLHGDWEAIFHLPVPGLYMINYKFKIMRKIVRSYVKNVCHIVYWSFVPWDCFLLGLLACVRRKSSILAIGSKVWPRRRCLRKRKGPRTHTRGTFGYIVLKLTGTTSHFQSWTINQGFGNWTEVPRRHAHQAVQDHRSYDPSWCPEPWCWESASFKVPCWEIYR